MMFLVRKHVIPIICLVISPPTLAETVAECKARLNDVVQCYVAQAQEQAAICSMKIELSILKGNLDSSCISSAKQEIAPFYSAASKSLSKSPRSLSLLKDAHAYWISSTNAMSPNPGELQISYKRRLQEREQGFEDKANRLLLER